MLKILNTASQIREARQEINKLKIGGLTPVFLRKLRRIFPFGVAVGDYLKSWDVYNTILWIQENISRDSRILDLGAFASELPISLYKLGFVNIYALDLNNMIFKMPYADKIHYLAGDLYRTAFKASSFQIITAISVIEHGFDCEKLMLEVARILRSGGYFILSFDYWHQKINTDTVTNFGISWQIFSKEEINNMIETGKGRNLYPVGELNFSYKESPIRVHGYNYTFGWMVLKKKELLIGGLG
jgi:SAM-dependent methyltransferase